MPANITYIGNASSSANSATYTFTDHAIGVASSDRIVLVYFASRKSGTATTITSVTIGGVSASEVIQHSANYSSGAQTSCIYALLVPTGTTATIVVTMAASAVQAGISVYTLTGSSVTAFDTHSGTSSPFDLSIEADGCGLAGVNSAGTSVSAWTGLTERDDPNVEGNLTWSTASDDFVSAQSPLSVTNSLSDLHIVAAAFSAAGEEGVAYGFRITEAGDSRITSDGSFRVTEDYHSGVSLVGGTGVATFTGNVFVPGAYSQSGSGTIFAVPTAVRIGKSTMSGSGTFAADGTELFEQSQAALSGSGTIVAFPGKRHPANFAATSTGAMTITPVVTYQSGFIGNGFGVFSAEGSEHEFGAVDLTGVAILQSTGSFIANGLADLTGSGSMTAKGRDPFPPSASLTGTGTGVFKGVATHRGQLESDIITHFRVTENGADFRVTEGGVDNRVILELINAGLSFLTATPTFKPFVPSIYAKHAALWQEVTPYAKVTGSWVPAQKVHVKDNGIWKRVY